MHTLAYTMCISADKQSKLHRSTQAEITALSETQIELATSSLPLVQSLFPLWYRRTHIHTDACVNLPEAQPRKSPVIFPGSFCVCLTLMRTHTCTLIDLHTSHQVCHISPFSPTLGLLVPLEAKPPVCFTFRGIHGLALSWTFAGDHTDSYTGYRADTWTPTYNPLPQQYGTEFLVQKIRREKIGWIMWIRCWAQPHEYTGEVLLTRLWLSVSPFPSDFTCLLLLKLPWFSPLLLLVHPLPIPQGVLWYSCTPWRVAHPQAVTPPSVERPGEIPEPHSAGCTPVQRAGGRLGHEPGGCWGAVWAAGSSTVTQWCL